MSYIIRIIAYTFYLPSYYWTVNVHNKNENQLLDGNTNLKDNHKYYRNKSISNEKKKSDPNHIYKDHPHNTTEPKPGYSFPQKTNPRYNLTKQNTPRKYFQKLIK